MALAGCSVGHSLTLVATFCQALGGGEGYVAVNVNEWSFVVMSRR